VLMESTANSSRARPGAETMPRFAELSQKGVFWTGFYAPQPNSIKSMFSLLSGYYPAADVSQIPRVRPRIPVKILSNYFKERGYRTALLHGGDFNYYNYLAFLEGRGFDALYDAVSLPNRADYARSSYGIDDRAIFDFAQSWIDESPAPFFLLLSPLLPHHPYDLPPGVTARFPEAGIVDKYHCSLYYIDELIGRLADHLRTRGLYERTIFVLVADHGEAFGQHRDNFMHAADLYQENVNVPLLISNPLLFSSATTSAVPAAHPDILPTLCDLLGFELHGPKIDGMSLLRPERNRIVFLSTHLSGDILGARDGNFKYILKTSSGRSELYDLSRDPGENKNLAAAFPERVRFYEQKVREWAAYTRALARAPFTPKEAG
jgi:lipoteichoic acid synthase